MMSEITPEIIENPPDETIFSCFIRNPAKLLPIIPDLPLKEIFYDLPPEQIDLLRHCLYSYESILVSAIKNKKVEVFALTYSISPYYMLGNEFLDTIVYIKKYKENEREKAIMTFNLPASLFPNHEINISHIIEKDLDTLEKTMKKCQKTQKYPIYS